MSLHQFSRAMCFGHTFLTRFCLQVVQKSIKHSKNLLFFFRRAKNDWFMRCLLGIAVFFSLLGSPWTFCHHHQGNSHPLGHFSMLGGLVSRGLGDWQVGVLAPKISTFASFQLEVVDSWTFTIGSCLKD